MVRPLRFALLIRVSTELQASQGESLRTQEALLTEAVATLGGKVAKMYMGQEHATSGSERALFAQLLEDASASPRVFDAVMVLDPSRWSRDNKSSEAGLEVLRDHGIKFFVLGQEHDLYDDHARLFLCLQSVINGYQARVMKRKSLQSRIHRAKEKGMPTNGKKPFGRTFNRSEGKWEVDKDKQRIVKDAAERYLAGESLKDLATEYGMNHSNLHKILMHRCGTEWDITFEAKDLNIREQVAFTIPALLPAATIKAVKQRATANKTYLHGHAKNPYLLSGFVFCEACGYTLFGQTNHNGHRYYRHSRKDGALNCKLNPRPWIRADHLEAEVIEHLFATFGNPAAAQEAIEKAVPNLDKIRKVQERLTRIDEELQVVERGRDRILSQIAFGKVTEKQAEKTLNTVTSRETSLQNERQRLTESIGGLPDLDTIERTAKQASLAFNSEWPTGKEMKLIASLQLAKYDIEGMTEAERQSLVRSTFPGLLKDGRPMGVYIEPIAGQAERRQKRWGFTIRGAIVNGAKCVTQGRVD